MKTNILMIILLSGVLFAQNGGSSAAGAQQGTIIVSPEVQMGGLNAGQGWSSGNNIGTGSENAKGEMQEPGKGWSTQEGEEKGNKE